MDEVKYSKERLGKSSILGVGADVVSAAILDGAELTLAEAERLIQKFLKRKVRD